MLTRRIWLCGSLASIAVAMSAWAEPPAATEEDYAQIQTAFLQEHFEQVALLSPPIIAQESPDPKTIRIWLWHCLSLERLKQISQALREIDRLKAVLSALPGPALGAASAGAIKLDPASIWPEVLFWEAEISRKANQFLRAQMAYQRLLANFPNSMWRSQAQLGLGLVFFEREDYEEASTQFRQVALISPGSSVANEALLLEGICNIQLKRFDQARALFGQLLQQPLPRQQRAHVTLCLGQALFGLGLFEEAIQAYKQTVEIDPDSQWAGLAKFEAGLCYFKQRRCRESLQAFAEHLQHRQTDESRAELLFAKGQCFMELGDEAQAVACFEKLQARTPNHPLAIEAAISKAGLLQRRHRVGEAILLLEEVLSKSIDPSQRLRSRLILGSAFLIQGETIKAVGQFQQAKDSADPELKQAGLNGLGDVQMFLEDAQAARQWYEQAIRTAPERPGALYATYQLGRLSLQAGRPSEAIEHFQRLVNKADSSMAADGGLALAFAYISNSQDDLARIELESLRAQNPRSAQAARAGYYLALLALKEAKVSEAKRLCNEAIRGAPDSDEAIEAHLLLADLVAGDSSPQEAIAALSQAFNSLQELPSRNRGRLAKKLGDLARQSGAYGKAIGWYEVAWHQLPAQRGELDYRVASCYEESGDLKVAVGRYRAISQHPWRIRGQLAAAKLMERDQKWQEAMAIYELLSHEPVPEAKIAEERLVALRTGARPMTSQ